MAQLTKTQVGFPKVSYSPQDLQQSANTRLIYSVEDLRGALTAAYAQPHTLSIIKLAADIFPSSTITIGTTDLDSDFAGVIIEGSGQFKIITVAEMETLFYINARATIRDVTIDVMHDTTTVLFTSARTMFENVTVNVDANVSYVFANSALQHVTCENIRISSASSDGYAFSLPHKQNNTLLRNVDIVDSGSLTAVFAGSDVLTTSTGWSASGFRITNVTNLLHAGSSFGDCYLQDFLDTGNDCALTGEMSGCKLIGFLGFDDVDFSTNPEDGNSFVTFRGKTGSATFKGGAGNVCVDIQGYDTLEIDSTSLVIAGNETQPKAYFPARVGIGDTSPSVDLSVSGELKIGSDGTSASAAGSGALRSVSGGLELSNGTQWQRVALADGYVTGTGAANQLARFTTASNLAGITTTASRVLTTDGSSVIGWNNSLPSGTTLNGSTIVTGDGAANRLAYWNGTSTVTSDADFNVNATDGYVGIGTATPLDFLHIAAPSTTPATSPGIRLDLVDTTWSSGQSIGRIDFAGNDASASASGVRARVECVASSVTAATDISFQVNAGGANPLEIMRLSGASSEVGILTDNPDNTLHVHKGSAGSVTANGNSPLVVENSTSCYINILTPDANERGILFGAPTSNADGGIIYNASSSQNLQFRTNGNTTRAVVTWDGYFGVGTSISPACQGDFDGAIATRSVSPASINSAGPGLVIGNESFMRLQFGASSSGNLTLHDGIADGQRLTLVCISYNAASTCVLPNSTSNNVKLSAQWLTSGDTANIDNQIDLIWDAASSVWRERSRSNNV